MNAAVYALPIFVCSVLIYGVAKGVDVFESFIKGARKGMGVALRILPYIIAMLFAVDLFSAGGGFELVGAGVCAVLGSVLPAELIPLWIMRPFSGGASIGLLSALYASSGADSYAGRVASVFMGSSETLFYTTSIYLGSIGISKTRYIVPVALFTDFCGMICSCILVNTFFN